METKTIDLGDGKAMTIVERDQMDMPANADKGSKQIRIKVMTDEDIDLGAIPEVIKMDDGTKIKIRKQICLLYTSPSPRDRTRSRMPSSA